MIAQKELEEKRVKTGHVVKKFNVNCASTGRMLQETDREREMYVHDASTLYMPKEN
jgi:hypothetical protein